MAEPFRIRALGPDEIRALYAGRLKEDFPPDELKSLAAIERLYAQGRYACYAADGAGIPAYAFFVKLGSRALVDYFAVRRDLRGQGVGSRFLQALVGGPLRGMDVVLLEADDPDAAPDADELDVRERRLRFYLRNGLVDTGVVAEVFGVAFRILALPVGDVPVAADARRAYAELYRAILPRKTYDAEVRL